MALLAHKKMKFLDRLFYDAVSLERALKEKRSIDRANAERSFDPTAKTAAVNMMPAGDVPGYEETERWIAVVNDTWERYGEDTQIGKCMRRRYMRRESVETTAAMEAIGVGTYYSWRNEFLLYAAFSAVKRGCKI